MNPLGGKYMVAMLEKEKKMLSTWSNPKNRRVDLSGRAAQRRLNIYIQKHFFILVVDGMNRISRKESNYWYGPTAQSPPERVVFSISSAVALN